MSILKAPPKQPKTVTVQARVEESAKTQLELYAEFIDASPSYVINEAKPVPMDGALLDALQDWSRQTPYRQMGDWVFASPDMDGKQPYWPETPLRCYVQPAAKRVGITKAIGWHSFRRTFATLLKGGGEDVKTRN